METFTCNKPLHHDSLKLKIKFLNKNRSDILACSAWFTHVRSTWANRA